MWTKCPAATATQRELLSKGVPTLRRAMGSTANTYVNVAPTLPPISAPEAIARIAETTNTPAVNAPSWSFDTSSWLRRSLAPLIPVAARTRASVGFSAPSATSAALFHFVAWPASFNELRVDMNFSRDLSMPANADGARAGSLTGGGVVVTGAGAGAATEAFCCSTRFDSRATASACASVSSAAASARSLFAASSNAAASSSAARSACLRGWTWRVGGKSATAVASMHVTVRSCMLVRLNYARVIHEAVHG